MLWSLLSALKHFISFFKAKNCPEHWPGKLLCILTLKPELAGAWWQCSSHPCSSFSVIPARGQIRTKSAFDASAKWEEMFGFFFFSLSLIIHKSLERRSICVAAECSAHDAPLRPAAHAQSPPSEGKLLGREHKKPWFQKKIQVLHESSQNLQPCHDTCDSGKKMEQQHCSTTTSNTAVPAGFSPGLFLLWVSFTLPVWSKTSTEASGRRLINDLVWKQHS